MLKYFYRFSFYFMLLVCSISSFKAQSEFKCFSKSNVLFLHFKGLNDISDFMNATDFTKIETKSDVILNLFYEPLIYNSHKWEKEDLRLNLYEYPNKENVLIIKVSKECYKDLLDEFSIYNAKDKSTSEHIVTSYQISQNYIQEFHENKNSNIDKYVIKLFTKELLESHKQSKQEELDRLKQEEAERIKQEKLERLKQEEAERIKQEEAERIKQEKLKQLKQEEAEKIKQEEAERITELEKIRNESYPSYSISDLSDIHITVNASWPYIKNLVLSSAFIEYPSGNYGMISGVIGASITYKPNYSETAIGLNIGYTKWSDVASWTDEYYLGNEIYQITESASYLYKQFRILGRFDWYLDDAHYLGSGLGFKRINETSESNNPEFNGQSKKWKLASRLCVGGHYVSYNGLGFRWEAGFGGGGLLVGLSYSFF